MYIASMDEGGGGFPHNDTNLIFKSTDGGNTWANTYTGTPFPGTGRVACSVKATSRACLPITAATGGTKAGVSLLRSTISFTWSIPSRALPVTPATSITSVPPTVV